MRNRQCGVELFSFFFVGTAGGLASLLRCVRVAVKFTLKMKRNKLGIKHKSNKTNRITRKLNKIILKRKLDDFLFSVAFEIYVC